MRSVFWCGPLAAAAVAMATAVSAQVATEPLPGEGSRGVRILEAEETEPALPAPPPDAPKRQTAPLRTPIIKFCERPFAAPDLRLSDGAGFDKALAAKLRTRKRVVVDLATPYGERDVAPAALTPWLGEVQASGGSVETKQYCDATRGALTSWLVQLFTPKPANPYRTARRYNVVLHADALDHVITQVEFTPRPVARP